MTPDTTLNESKITKLCSPQAQTKKHREYLN